MSFMSERNKPRVSEILELIFWENWDIIPKKYLDLGIAKGNCFHSRAEVYIKTGVIQKCICDHEVKSHNDIFKKFLFDINEESFEVTMVSEQAIEGNDLLTNGIDLQIIENNKIRIIDFKTTSEVHKQKWLYQLTMYVYLHNGSWDIDWNKYSLEVWHYNAKYKVTKVLLDKPSEDDIKEIKKAILSWHKIKGGN